MEARVFKSFFFDAFVLQNGCFLPSGLKTALLIETGEKVTYK